jgi:hypothetical protein
LSGHVVTSSEGSLATDFSCLNMMNGRKLVLSHCLQSL